jgi:hypothetical protein
MLRSRHFFIAPILGLALVGAPGISPAAKWVKLQDVSPASAPAVHISGFIEPIAPLDKIMLDYAVRSLDVPYPTAAPPASRPIVDSISRSIDNQITAELVLSF